MANPSSRPSGRPPTVGIIADWLEGNYQSAVVGGAVQAAREAGVNLLLLADSMPKSRLRLGERHNVVYDLGRSDCVDAVAVMSGPVGRNLGHGTLGDFVDRYRPRPICSIGQELDGATSIVVSGDEALRQGIRHLVLDHGYRQVAFVGGPEVDIEAGARLQAYREVLAECGIEPADLLITFGNFRYQSGADAVHTLLDERGQSFNSIVAASDTLALGAIDALRVRNIRVPRDIGVLGFDDISEARHSAPPLTTIRQPLRQLGRLAVETLLRQLRGEPVDDLYVLNAELVVRRSCGCEWHSSRTAAPISVDDVAAADAEEDELVHRLIIERRRRSLSEATEILGAAFDMESLEAALQESLPHLGVPSAYIVLDEDVSVDRARVIFAHDPGRDPIELEALRQTRIEGTTLPEGLLPKNRTYAMVVEPLFFKDDPLGYAVMEMRPEDAYTYDAFGALRVRISGAVKVALLIEELQVRAGQLRQAQKMETLGQLSGGIAHDFNNLLQAIRGYAELASAAEHRSAEANADLVEIVRAADRASQLTRQLLTFSQPTRANARVVDVNECIDESIPMIRRLVGPTIQLSAVLRPEAGTIVIDPAQLEQAIVNLCVNSRDAMPEGGSVTIQTGRGMPMAAPFGVISARVDAALPGQKDTELTYISVSDTGAGISPAIRDRIFEPFFTTKETGQGTGLGLSIVYGIVHNASGDIVVESESGKGTRIWMLFPAAAAAQESAAGGMSTPIKGTETVLLVEDEQAIRKLAERVLGGAGYRVLSASNGMEARTLWAANRDRIDLVLSDVTMPGLSGIAFASEIAAGPRPPRTLFISGRLPGQAEGPVLPEGAAFLAKPFSVAALLDAVRAALDDDGRPE